MEGAAIIDWVHTACEEWAGQIRRRDGMLPLADLATYDYLHSPAGLDERAQEVSAAVFRMRATPAMLVPYRVLVSHYLFYGRPKPKMKLLGTDKNDYWRSIQTAHAYLAARIDYPMLESA
jgi:hypothetical protein